MKKLLSVALVLLFVAGMSFATVNVAGVPMVRSVDSAIPCPPPPPPSK